MPSLRIEVNGKVRASVCVDDLDVLAFNVQGVRSDEEMASLYLAGGRYPNDDQSVYMVWIDSDELFSDDVVGISLVASEPNSHHELSQSGTISDEDIAVADSMIPCKLDLDALKSKPLLRTGYGLKLSDAKSTIFRGNTAVDTLGFQLNILMNSHVRDSASVYLSSYDFEGLVSGADLIKHVETRLNVGEILNFSATDRLDA
jgi:hypothetical protein